MTDIVDSMTSPKVDSSAGTNAVIENEVACSASKKRRKRAADSTTTTTSGEYEYDTINSTKSFNEYIYSYNTNNYTNQIYSDTTNNSSIYFDYGFENITSSTSLTSGSCDGICGSGAGGCFCDCICTNNGDCCNDYTSVCLEYEKEFKLDYFFQK